MFDLAWIAFFFLIRPGDYCDSGTDTVSTPFNLKDTQLFMGTQIIQATTASLDICSSPTFAILLFTMHKTVSRESPPETEQHYTPARVKWRPPSAVWHTYNKAAPPATLT